MNSFLFNESVKKLLLKCVTKKQALEIQEKTEDFFRKEIGRISKGKHRTRH